MNKTLIRYATAIPILLVIFFVAGCQQPAPTASPSPSQMSTTEKTYVNTEYSFSVEYPADWNLNTNPSDEDKSKGIAAIIEGPESSEYDSRANIIIEAEKYPQKFTAEEYADAIEQQILKKNLPDYTVLEEETISIGGIPAMIRTFTAKVQNLPFKFIQAYFTDGENCYSITYNVTTDLHDEYIECFNLVISTFSFNK